MKEEFVIITDKLTKRFGDFVAADGISFTVNKGEIFGFLGANGAGKTTAMRMLCGLSRPSSGTATIAGFDVYKQTEQIKKNIGYMSQKFSLYEDLTVMENIKFFGGIYGLSNKQIRDKGDRLLEGLSLQQEARKLVGALPLGWKQKLSFSVAVLHEPKIVFLDEPTGGVDPVTRRQFWSMIYDVADRGWRYLSPRIIWTKRSTAAGYLLWWTDRLKHWIHRETLSRPTGLLLWMKFFIRWPAAHNAANNMKQLLIFIRKEFAHVLRDKKTLLILFGMPVVQILIFGFALTNEVRNARIVVMDEAGDMASQRIIGKVAASRYFEIVRVAMNRREIEDAFKQGDIRLALIFPPNFYRDLSHEHQASLQVIADASDPNMATTLTNYISSIVTEYALENGQEEQAPYTVLPEVRYLYNPQLRGLPTLFRGLCPWC